MLNDLFKKYQNLSIKEIDIDSHHKKQLQSQLFKENKLNKAPKKPFWTWTKAIFTAPVMAAIAIIFFLNSNQETVKQVLLPQEALAQALENTFQLDSLEMSLGLPQDGKLYHRTINYINNRSGAAGALSFAAPYTQDLWTDGYTQKMDLWTDGSTLRRDSVSTSNNSKYRDFRSFLTDPKNDINCSLVLYKECQPFSEILKDDIDKVTSKENGILAPLIADEENLISDISVNKQTEDTNSADYFISWSTLKPLESAFIEIQPNMHSAERKAIDNLNGNYTNIFKNGKYWHQVLISKGVTFLDYNRFFKIITNVENEDISQIQYSMLYELNYKDFTVDSLNTEEIIEELKKENAPANVAMDVIYDSFDSVMFFLGRENFNTPISSESVEKNGKNVLQLRYITPENYFKNSYFIDLFIDSTNTHFLGYDLVKDNHIVESMWIEDEVIPESNKFELFDKESWERSIAEEDRAKEPERQESEKWWLEFEKTYNPDQNEVIEIEPTYLDL